jgi:hypothetical protein
VVIIDKLASYPPALRRVLPGWSTGLAVFDRSALRAEAIGRCWSRGRVLAWLADPERLVRLIRRRICPYSGSRRLELVPKRHEPRPKEPVPRRAGRPTVALDLTDEVRELR